MATAMPILRQGSLRLTSGERPTTANPIAIARTVNIAEVRVEHSHDDSCAQGGDRPPFEAPRDQEVGGGGDGRGRGEHVEVLRVEHRGRLGDNRQDREEADRTGPHTWRSGRGSQGEPEDAEGGQELEDDVEVLSSPIGGLDGVRASQPPSSRIRGDRPMQPVRRAGSRPGACCTRRALRPRAAGGYAVARVRSSCARSRRSRGRRGSGSRSRLRRRQ